ncbi:MAG: hypothetical protein IK080_10655 [Clostridia bacterium]|nr:hypothetical protein [Clostridia bacterium]
MKKITVLFVCLALLAASVTLFAACDKQKPAEEPTISDTAEEIPEEIPDAIVGGWENDKSPVITEEFRQVFEKAAANLDGVDYTPIAYLSSQVVAGKNHRVLCKAVTVVPDAVPTYAIVTVYEDLTGNAEITDVVRCDVEVGQPGLAGGWNEPDSPEVTDAAKDALTKACETLTGAEYTPVALLATQVVAGTNYRILCESKATVPGAQTEYVIVTVYADLQGNAEITDTVTFGADAQAEEAPAEEVVEAETSEAAAEIE